MFDSIILRLIHYVLALGTFLKLWIFRVPALSYKKSVPRTVQSDARTFKKLPIHIGLLVLENDISYSDIANTLLWSAAMGVSYISVYDTDGKEKYSALDSPQAFSFTSFVYRCNINISLDYFSIVSLILTNMHNSFDHFPTHQCNFENQFIDD